MIVQHIPSCFFQFFVEIIAIFFFHVSKLKIIRHCQLCTFAANFIHMEFPKNDRELRMYCLGLAADNDLSSEHIDMDKAKEYYKFIATPSDTPTAKASADWLQRIEGFVRQYCELVQIESEHGAHRIPSTEETATHMAVRLAAEREIQGRKDYLAEVITHAVVQHFADEGMLSKYPELHANRSEM